MTRTSDVPVARRVLTARAGSVPRIVLTAATGLAIFAHAGCQSFVKRNASKGNDPPPNVKPLGGDVTTATKTDFHREATPEQGFNVHLEYARALESQGDFEAAVSEYQKAVDAGSKTGSAAGGSRLAPKQLAQAERKMAGALDRMGRFTQAEVHYRKALALAPGDAKAWNDCGYSYYLQNRFEDANRALKTADKLEPNEPRILTNLGLALAASGKSEEALGVLTRAGGQAVGHANLAYVSAALGRTEEAREHYQKALELQPELSGAREALARLDANLAKGTIALASATSTVPNAAETKSESRDSADEVPLTLNRPKIDVFPSASAGPPPLIATSPSTPASVKPVAVPGSTVDPQTAPASSSSRPKPAPASPPIPWPNPPRATSALSTPKGKAPADVQLVRTRLNPSTPVPPARVLPDAIPGPKGAGPAAPRVKAVDPEPSTSPKARTDTAAQRARRLLSNPAAETPP